MPGVNPRTTQCELPVLEATLVSDLASGELKLSVLAVATVATVDVDDSVFTGRGDEGGGGISAIEHG